MALEIKICGLSTPETVETAVEAGADFIALGDWIWHDPHNVAAVIADAASRLKLPETAA